MAPLTPHWQQPSHGDIQEVVIGKEGFTSKSFSKVTVAPFGLFAKMSFPPCTRTTVPTYATVQMGRDAHLNLNSDLVYINHSCEPSLILDMPTLSMLAGPQGLRPGTELTFFYPSTEWAMAQPFDCFCATSSCKGRIAGAKDMSMGMGGFEAAAAATGSAPAQQQPLKGMWLNGYIRDMLAEQEEMMQRGGSGSSSSASSNSKGPKEKAAQESMRNGTNGHAWGDSAAGHGSPAAARAARVVGGGSSGSGSGSGGGAGRMGPTSRELSGEMGGDTTAD